MLATPDPSFVNQQQGITVKSIPIRTDYCLLSGRIDWKAVEEILGSIAASLIFAGVVWAAVFEVQL